MENCFCLLSLDSTAPNTIHICFNRDRQEMLYEVDLDKEGKHEIPRGRICMNEEQVRILRGESALNASFTTPTQRPDVSLGKLLA